jgi:hypothetical protein
MGLITWDEIRAVIERQHLVRAKYHFLALALLIQILTMCYTN